MFKKRAKAYICFIFALILMSLSVTSASATTSTLWDSLDIYSPAEYTPTTSSIQSLDVNKNEQILITLNNNDSIIIFDSNGNIEKQFNFYSAGSYSARFNDANNNIQLYLVRGNCYVEFTQQGEYCGFSKCGYNQWEKESNLQKHYTVNQNTYSLEKAPLTITEDCYARLVKTEGKGNETVFYDVASPQIVRNILFIFMLLLIFVLAPLFFVCKIVKYARDRHSLYPAPPQKIIPVSKKQKALKWSITALLLVKIAFTIVEFITTSMEPYTYFSATSIFASFVVAAATVGTAGTVIFLCLAVLTAYCLVVGIVLLLSLKHKPTPALILLSIVETADILYLFMFLFSPSEVIVNLLGLIFNLCIVAMLFVYRYITIKNRNKY